MGSSSWTEVWNKKCYKEKQFCLVMLKQDYTYKLKYKDIYVQPALSINALTVT